MTALPFQGIDFTAGLRAGVAGLRVAYSPALGYATVDRDVAGLVAAAAECFEEMGAVVEEVDPGFADPAPMFRTLWWTGAAGAFGQLPAESIALMDPELQEIIAEGASWRRRKYMPPRARGPNSARRCGCSTPLTTYS